MQTICRMGPIGLLISGSLVSSIQKNMTDL
jgi:hypothetical protein